MNELELFIYRRLRERHLARRLLIEIRARARRVVH